MSSSDKRAFIKSFGCQMNVYDSERMAEALGAHGFGATDDPALADVIVLNTCHIREKATEKIYSELGRLRQLKSARARQGLDTVIAVAGCVAQAEGAEILARAPVVDLVIGPQSYHRLPGLLAQAKAERKQLIDIEFPEDDKFGHLPVRTPPRSPTAFLTVQEGCDRFCTFCVVPYTRGMEFSRPVKAVVAEAERLVAQGVREITLLGQNVNAYHGEGPDGGEWTLARLLHRLAEIDGLDRLRYTTSHPRDMGADLIAAHGALPTLMPYLHLPFQAGSDRILAAMNRKHSIADYLRILDAMRAARPDIALSTDIIVGFPGETHAEFRETLAVVEQVGFAQAFSFKYSPRPGTPAANLAEQVPEAVKSERLLALQELLGQKADAFNAAMVGRTVPVLFEGAGRKPGQLTGRSPYLQPVHVDAHPNLLGEIMPVTILAQSRTSLTGALFSEGDATKHIVAAE